VIAALWSLIIMAAMVDVLALTGLFAFSVRGVWRGARRSPWLRRAGVIALSLMFRYWRLVLRWGVCAVTAIADYRLLFTGQWMFALLVTIGVQRVWAISHPRKTRRW